MTVCPPPGIVADELLLPHDVGEASPPQRNLDRCAFADCHARRARAQFVQHDRIANVVGLEIVDRYHVVLARAQSAQRLQTRRRGSAVVRIASGFMMTGGMYVRAPFVQ